MLPETTNRVCCFYRSGVCEVQDQGAGGVSVWWELMSWSVDEHPLVVREQRAAESFRILTTALCLFIVLGPCDLI